MIELANCLKRNIKWKRNVEKKHNIETAIRKNWQWIRQNINTTHDCHFRYIHIIISRYLYTNLLYV